MFWCTSHKCSPDQSKSNTCWVIFCDLREGLMYYQVEYHPAFARSYRNK